MPFTKLDSGIINSSVWSYPAAERVVWITMLALADETGFVPSSFSGLVRSANVSEIETKIAIEKFSAPDADSQTEQNEGKRILKVEGGWMILNYEKYQERTEKDYLRDKMRVYRGNKDVKMDAETSNISQAREVLDYLNQKIGAKHRPVKSNLSRIRARLTEKYTVDDCKKVIDHKTAEWLGDPRMCQYLRVETLFAPTKFGGYVEAARMIMEPKEEKNTFLESLKKL